MFGVCTVKKKGGRRGRNCGSFFKYDFCLKAQHCYRWKINCSSSKDDLVVQNGRSECGQRKEKPQSHSPYGHSCSGRINLSTLEHSPYFREFLSLTGTGTTLSRNFRMTQPDSYGLFHFCKLQQNIKSDYKMGLGTGMLNLPR